MKKNRIFYDRNRLLGKGFFGFVCLGELLKEDGNRQDVAVKVVWTNASSREEDRELVQMRLDHPNVVKLLHHEYQANDELSCFALELCDVSLDKVFEDRRTGGTKYRHLLPSQLEFILQLSLGLEYIHSQNLVHRDIKSGNVLISKSFHNGEPTVKWADFGLAKTTNLRGEFEMSGQRGTDLYWASEICNLWENSGRFEENNSNGKNVIITKISDVFSSGIVFFEFCTNGIHPFGNGLNQIRINLMQLNAYNMNREPKLRQSHFAYKMIKTMLRGEPQMRPNLREIVLSLSSPKKTVFISRSMINKTEENQLMNQVEPIQQQNLEQKEIEAAYQQLEKAKDELHYLCSIASPTNEQMGRVIEIVSNDSVGIVNTVDENGFSPLLLTCRNNQSYNLNESIKALVTTKRRSKAECLEVDVNYQDRIGYNAFHYISKNYLGNDFLEIMELLIKCGLDVNLTEQKLERNALLLLLRDNRRDDIVQIIEALIKAGINLKHKNLNGSTALSYLCQCYTNDNLIQIAQLLIENGVDVTEKDEPYGWTSLHVLCRYYTNPNLIDVAKLLVSNDVDVTAKECEGCTALHFICGYYAHDNLIEVVELLIENGVDVNAKSQNGWTALHNLCRHYTQKNLLEVVKFLIEKGIDVNAKDATGSTAFHFLCRHYSHDNLIELAEMFIENGFDVTG